MQIILKNVRTLQSQPPIPIRPLTLLVGDNSTGKTTFLAMLSHVCQYEFPYFRPTFNNPPFDLGPFDAIATYMGGRGGRADSFSIGFVDEKEGQEARLLATYVNHKGQPQLQEATASGKIGEAVLRVDEGGAHANIRVSLAEGKTTQHKEVSLDLARFPQPELTLRLLFRVALVNLLDRETRSEDQPTFSERYLELLNLVSPARRSVFALAPVRTKPKRTYDETREEFDPEGDHVFVLLARLWQEEEAEERLRLLKALETFGQASALFERIKVKRLGRKPSDPFQIFVALGGPPANLLDVGYGVSQALPLVIQSLLAANKGLLLLQQPEIHLHPRAQAALGSFFAHLVASEGKQLVVETHSDYLLDRVRREVAEGTISAQDVSILFFDRRHIRTRIHQLNLDENGNVLNTPKSYRQFFLEEEISLFNRSRS